MKATIHTPPNEAPITELYAVLSVDDTGDGMCATIVGGIGMPLVVSYERLVPFLRQEAAMLSKTTNRTLKLVRFSVREDMEEFKP